MNKKQIIFLICLLSIIFYTIQKAYPSWQAYKDIEAMALDGEAKVGYIDIDGDFNPEIIIQKQYGAGSGHYIEDLRIFKDPEGERELKLIFYITTLEKFFGYDIEGIAKDYVSKVEFSDPDSKNGLRKIYVKSYIIYYNTSEWQDDDESNIKEVEDLGNKIYRWNGEKFVEVVRKNE